MEPTTIAIDLAKRVFQIHYVEPETGAAGLTSRKRGRTGNRRLDTELAQRVLTIIRDRYADFGPTLACEKLAECHGIWLAKETVRRWMRDAGAPVLPKYLAAHGKPS
ncbi:hypothetical protein C7412_103363 [Paraburkholderia silvatlantica]|nr:hypothetical protein C7412_103363 [Paraburkholderia silvatlantica]